MGKVRPCEGYGFKMPAWLLLSISNELSGCVEKVKLYIKKKCHQLTSSPPISLPALKAFVILG